MAIVYHRTGFDNLKRRVRLYQVVEVWYVEVSDHEVVLSKTRFEGKKEAYEAYFQSIRGF